MIAAAACLSALPGARAEIPNRLEPEYGEAVLLYNAKDYAGAVRRIDSVLSRAPENARIPEFLELKALSLKASRKDGESADVYQLLIQSRVEAGRPAEAAPYHFELGMIRDREKRVEDAKRHFSFAAEEGFNEGAAHFYLGNYAYRSQDWSEADTHFRAVASSDAEDLGPPAYFYLGQSALKRQDGAGATRSFLAARNSARNVLANERSSDEAKGIARQVSEATEKALAPFDRSSLFAHLSVLTGYDSNPLLAPTSSDGTFAASGASTLRQTLAAGIGYATSPLKYVQLVPSYRGALNLNLNADARSTEFFSHTAGLYVNLAPLARLSYGAKAEFTLAFRNEGGEGSGRFAYTRFFNALAFGPYVRYELRPRLMLGLDVTIQPQKYPGDSGVDGDPFARSGEFHQIKLSAQNERGSRLWNPRGAFKIEGNDTDGNEFRSSGFGLELSNLFRVLPDTELTGTVEYQRTTYGRRSSGTRKDGFFAARAGIVHRRDARWSWLGSLEGAINDSDAPQTVGPSDIFAYRRLLVSLGATYSF